MDASEAEKPTARVVQTKTRGECIIVSNLELVDENPALLAAGVPIFLEDEWTSFKTMTPAEAARAWGRRVRALGEEREARIANPTRTIYTGAPGEA